MTDEQAVLKNNILASAGPEGSVRWPGATNIVGSQKDKGKSHIGHLTGQLGKNCAATIRQFVQNHGFELQALQQSGELIFQLPVMAVNEEDSPRIWALCLRLGSCSCEPVFQASEPFVDICKSTQNTCFLRRFLGEF